MVIIKKLFLLILFFMPTKHVYGLECGMGQLNEMKLWAQAAEIEYIYIKEYNLSEHQEESNLIDIQNRFLVTISNLREFCYVYEDYTGIVFNNASSTKGDFFGGTTHTFYFYVKPEYPCGNRLLRSYSITLPRFNVFSTHELCEGIEEFDLCKRWSDRPLLEEEFIKRVTDYRNKPIDKDEPYIPLESDRWDIVINWLVENNIYIAITLILGITAIIIVRIREQRRRVL